MRKVDFDHLIAFDRGYKDPEEEVAWDKKLFPILNQLQTQEALGF